MIERARVLGWAVTIVLVARTAAAAPPVYVTVPAPGTAVVAPASNVAPTLVPVTLAAGGDIEKLDIGVLAIARDGTAPSVRSNAVTVVPHAHPTSLQVAVDFDTLYVPGTYDVTLSIAPRAEAGSDGGVPASQELAIKVVVPAAVLRPLPKLVIDREVPLPFMDKFERVEPTTLQLHEIGNASYVDPIVTQEGVLSVGDKPIGAELVGSPQHVGAGSAADVLVSLHGEFPMGTVSGTLLVTGHQLAAPVTVAVEVRSHHSSWWVLVLFAAGAFAGFEWRSRLLAKRDELAAKLGAARMRENIDAFIAGYPPGWLDEIVALRAKRDDISPDKPDSLSGAEQALKEAHSKRIERITSLAQTIRAGIAATRTSFRLPMGLGLDRAARAYDQASTDLRKGNLIDALQYAANAADEVDRVIQQCQDWCGKLKETLTLNDPAVGVPASAQSAVTDAKTKLGAALDAAIAADPPETRLARQHDAWAAANTLATLLARVFESFARALPAELTPAQAARLRSASELRETPPESPDLAIAEAIATAKRLVDTVRTVASELYPQGMPQPINDLIAAGNYAQALTPPPRATLPTGSDEGRGKETSARQAGATGSPLHETFLAPAKAIEIAPVAPVVPIELPPSEPTSATIETKLDGVSFLRWVIAAGISSLAAWAIYGDAFVGTRVECASIFAVGFLTDLTTDTAIDGILTKLKALRSPIGSLSSGG